MTDLKVVALGDCVRPVKTWNPLKVAGEDEFTYIDLSAVDQESKQIVGARNVSCAEAPSRARQLVEAGDVLVSTVRPNLNGVARVGIEHHGATVSTGFCVLRPVAETLDGGYAFQWVKSPSFVADMVSKATGASYPAVSDRIILESRLPLPSLPEQRRIAAILDQADALRAKRREALAQLDSLTQSIFIEMFGDPSHSTASFPTCSLDALLASPLQNGAYYPKETYSNDGVEMVHMSDAFNGLVKRGALKRVDCGDRDLIKYRLLESDILIARRSLTYEGAAKPCRVPASSEPLIFESSFIRVSPDLAKVTTEYLFRYLQNDRVRQRHIRPFVTQSTISGINQSNLEQVSVVVPPIDLQRVFETRIHGVETLKAIHLAAIAEADALFASLQHRAFTGLLS